VSCSLESVWTLVLERGLGISRKLLVRVYEEAVSGRNLGKPLNWEDKSTLFIFKRKSMNHITTACRDLLRAAASSTMLSTLKGGNTLL
jgi:hypothetical protein